MARTYFPEEETAIFISVPELGDGLEYKVSRGIEMVNGKPNKVYKVQLSCNNKIIGRMNPSFPLDTNVDYSKLVFDAINLIKTKN